ncbi:hypothetical protein INT45_012477 [Circinella minor]|uniref:HTH CENPB-type domain-containing protein n=1 Tax=Circinella minor TaxID=1195481 RepID=A0A8H7RR66_9FUNG|nr:hypothetical protein INT45_012477 [Circinella minor]
MLWIENAEDNGIPINWAMIKKAAAMFAEKLKILQDDFKISNGWQSRFRKRMQIKHHQLHGEEGSVSIQTAKEFIQQIQEKISKYELKDIYNMNETAVLYQAPPASTILRNAYPGVKKDRKILTVVLTCNADGSDKREPLIIGNSEKPASFKKIRAREYERAYMEVTLRNRGIRTNSPEQLFCINQLHGIHWIKKSWNDISIDIIKNCWRSALLRNTLQNPSVSNDPLPNSDVILSQKRISAHSSIIFGQNASLSSIDFDPEEEKRLVYQNRTDDQIVEQIIKGKEGESRISSQDGIVDDLNNVYITATSTELVPSPMKTKEKIYHIDTVLDFLETTNDDDESVPGLATKLRILRDKLQNKMFTQQSSLDSFFSG